MAKRLRLSIESSSGGVQEEAVLRTILGALRPLFDVQDQKKGAGDSNFRSFWPS
jgi:hypothetical protein